MNGHQAKPSMGDASSLFGAAPGENDFFAAAAAAPAKQGSIFDAVPEEAEEPVSMSNEDVTPIVEQVPAQEEQEEGFLDDSAYDELAESWMPPVAPAASQNTNTLRETFDYSNQYATSQPSHARIPSAPSSNHSAGNLTPQQQSNPYFPNAPQQQFDYSPYGSPVPNVPAPASVTSAKNSPAPTLLAKKKLDAYDPPPMPNNAKPSLARRNTPSIMPFGGASPSIYGVPPAPVISPPPQQQQFQAPPSARIPSQPPPPRRTPSATPSASGTGYSQQPPYAPRPTSVPPPNQAQFQPPASNQSFMSPPAQSGATFSPYPSPQQRQPLNSNQLPPQPPQPSSGLSSQSQQQPYSQPAPSFLPAPSYTSPQPPAQSTSSDPYAQPPSRLPAVPPPAPQRQQSTNAFDPPAPSGPARRPSRVFSPPPPPTSRPQSRTSQPSAPRPNSRNAYEAANIPLPPSRMGIHQQQSHPPRTSSPLARRRFGSQEEEMTTSPVPNLAFQPPSPVGDLKPAIKMEDEEEVVSPSLEEEISVFDQVKQEDTAQFVEVKREPMDDQSVTPVLKQEGEFSSYNNWYDEQDQLQSDRVNGSNTDLYAEESSRDDPYGRRDSDTTHYQRESPKPYEQHTPYVPQVNTNNFTTDPESMQDQRYNYEYRDADYSPAQRSQESSGSTGDSPILSAAGTYSARSDRTNSLEGATQGQQIGYNPANDLYSSYNPRKLSYPATQPSSPEVTQMSLPPVPPPMSASPPVDPYAPRSRSASTYSNQASSYSNNVPQFSPNVPDYTPQPGKLNGFSSYEPAAIRNMNDQQDNLTRQACPIVTFGLGGRMLTYFPPDSNSFQSTMYGSSPYAAAAEGLSSSSQIIKFSDLASNLSTTLLSTFPGPLFQAGGNNKAANAKKKKDASTWLEEQIADFQKELGFIAGAPAGQDDERESRTRKVEERKLLFDVVRIILENDGNLSSPEAEAQIRTALVPAGKQASGDFSTAAELVSIPRSRSPPISSSAVQGSDLSKIQSLLEQGDRQEAITFAIGNKMWGHAMIMSSSMDREAWKRTVAEFLRVEFGSSATPAGQTWEPLKVAYGLFSGESDGAVRHLGSLPNPGDRSPRGPFPPALSQAPSRAQSPAPMSLDPGVYAGIPASSLRQWRNTAAIMLSSKVSGGTSALVALGDALASQSHTFAAHVCYLLSGNKTLLGGLGQSGSRAVILGCDSPEASSSYAVDLDGVMLTEIHEFALSLTPITKGQETFGGLPHLQAYKLLHAVRLADINLTSKASKYCDAIASTLKASTKASAFYHPVLVAQVKELSDRLNGSSAKETSGSWVSRKMARPTLDSIWSNLEGRFASFVAGDEQEALNRNEAQKKASIETAAAAAGPFAQYTSISSANTSGTVSRNASHADLRSRMTPLQENQPNKPSQYSQPSYSSNFTASPPKVSQLPGPPRGRGHQSQPSLGALAFGSDPYAAAPAWGAPPPSFLPSNPEDQGVTNQEDSVTPPVQQNSDGWWGAANNTYNQDASGSTPAFQPVQQNFSEDDSGFISTMGTASRSVTPSYSASQNKSFGQTQLAEDDEEDLGFGNSSSRKPSARASPAPDDSTTSARPAQAEQSAAAESPEAHALKTSASSSWLGRLFRKDNASPGPQSGPIRAKLGEETSFVYDPEQKRWVNKKVGGSAAPSPAPSAPPPRASTVSPSPSPSEGPPARFASVSPPPVSRAPMTSGPPARSASAAGPPPPGSSRPAAKRAARSKYVEIT